MISGGKDDQQWLVSLHNLAQIANFGHPEFKQPLRPQRKRLAIKRVIETLSVSEGRACKVLRQPCMTQRYLPHVCNNEEPLTNGTIELASLYERYRTSRIHGHAPVYQAEESGSFVRSLSKIAV